MEKNNHKLTYTYHLGGLEEVGKNCYAIEHDDEIIMIDCGVKMPRQKDLGCETIIPDFTHIKENIEKFKGIFITHGHEDHIGAIPWLLKQISCPKIYAPRIACEFLRRKFKEHKINLEELKCELIETHHDFVLKTKYFTIKPFITVHSIPDAFGLVIDTPNGKIVTSGDYKFDLTPIGPITDFHRITEAGQEGCDLLLADSTNSLVPGYSRSEAIVLENIDHVFASAKGRIIVSTFSSNIYRIQQIVNVAIKYNRKILVFGRSMDRGIEASLRLKYIKCHNPRDIFIKPKQADSIDNSKILIICTGSQGEPMAVLNRISKKQHNDITITRGDTIIFSSNPIPGNFLPVKIIVNRLSRLGANVIQSSSLQPLHTSGHAPINEQKWMFAMLKPKNFMPIHGEYNMLDAHCKTAIKMGVDKDNVFICKNGDRLSLNKGKVSFAETIKSGVIYVDGNNFTPYKDNIMTARNTLLNSGVIIVIYILNNKSQYQIIKPIITSRGTFYVKENLKMLYELRMEIFKDIERELKKETDQKIIEQRICDIASSFIHKRKRRNPLVIPVKLINN